MNRAGLSGSPSSLPATQRAQKCYELQCFFCPELRNAMNYNALFVLNSEMLWITLLVLCSSRKDNKLRCDMVSCDMIWCDIVWYVVMWYGVIWFDMMWFDLIWCDTRCDMLWYGVVWHEDLVRVALGYFFPRGKLHFVVVSGGFWSKNGFSGISNISRVPLFRCLPKRPARHSCAPCHSPRLP